MTTTEPSRGAATTSTATAPASADVDRVVPIGGGRGLYLRCTGSGSPTVVMESGDEDTGDAYDFAIPDVARVARTCVYDRANLGRSDPAPGPRGLKELVGDVERLLEAAAIPGPYVLVGTSGGGYIVAGYAVAHPRDTAGIVLVETAAPFPDPPADLIEATDPANPENVEKRDYLQVEKDAWDGRERIGDIPVTVISDDPSRADLAEAPEAERRLMRRNVEAQKGWLVLSPQAEQIVVRTGHAVEEEDPQLVIDAIVDVVRAAR